MIANPQQVEPQRHNQTAAIILRMNDSDTDFWREALSQAPVVTPPQPSTLFWASHFAEHQDRDRTFRELEESTYVTRLFEAGWDGYDAPVPAEEAVTDTLYTLHKIKQDSTLTPYSVLPSAEGGVGISFRGRDNKRAVIELLNGASSSYTLYGIGHPTESLEFDLETDLSKVIQRLTEYL